jgi:hypothetical protein
MRECVLGLLCLCLAGSSARAAPRIDGKWHCEAFNGVMNIAIDMVLKQEGVRISGTTITSKKFRSTLSGLWLQRGRSVVLELNATPVANSPESPSTFKLALLSGGQVLKGRLNDLNEMTCTR